MKIHKNQFLREGAKQGAGGKKKKKKKKWKK